MDYVKGVDRNQRIMTSLDEMVHSEAFVRIIDAFLDSLDLWVIKKCEAQNATTYVLPKANAANKKYEVFGMEKFKYHAASHAHLTGKNILSTPSPLDFL